MQMIALEEALKLMRQTDKFGRPATFELEYDEYNSETRLVGERKKVKAQLNYINKGQTKSYDNKAVNMAYEGKAKAPKRLIDWDGNGIVCIKIMATNELRFVHTWLIGMVNGFQVKLYIHG